MRDHPLDYETVRRARNERGLRHDAWYRVSVEIYRVVVALLGREAPDCWDITQDALLEVHDELDAFESRAGGTFTAWIRTIARHTTIDYCRRMKTYERLFSRDHEAAEMVKYDGPYDIEQLERFQDERLLSAAFAALPPELRIPLYLRYQEGKSIQEAAAELGLPAGTVKSRCSRAARILREHIDLASSLAPDARTGTSK